jgi:hypothetical protein
MAIRGHGSDGGGVPESAVRNIVPWIERGGPITTPEPEHHFQVLATVRWADGGQTCEPGTAVAWTSTCVLVDHCGPDRLQRLSWLPRSAVRRRLRPEPPSRSPAGGPSGRWLRSRVRAVAQKD